MILINLLPSELRRHEAPKIVLPEVPVKKTLMIAGAGVLALQLLLSAAALITLARHGIIKRETRTLYLQLDDLRRVKKQTSEAAKRISEIKMLTEKKFFWALVLDELTKTVTRGVWLRSLALEEQTVQTKEANGSRKKPKEKKKEKEKRPGKTKAEATKTGSIKVAPASVETYAVLRLEGSCSGGGQETSLIGKYLKSLRDSAYFKELFGDQIDISNIRQRKLGEAEVFDFVVQCRFRKEKS
jgi:hypothetical protein